MNQNLSPASSLDDAPPAFAEPWQAQAFAMVLTLHRAGAFTWPEWATVLAQQIAQAQRSGDPDGGDTYYHHWLAALEGLVATKDLGSADELARCRHAWSRAAQRTPHGQPIELQRTDFAG